MIIPVILSGGSGTRLWPLSTRRSPKQFHRLTGDHTCFQETVLRVAGLNDLHDPIIVCGQRHVGDVEQQMNEVGLTPTILVEPSPRNTAPAIGAACLQAIAIDPEAVVLVLPSDHVIGSPQTFRETIEEAVPTAESGRLVTFGVVPTHPATGYGYIQSGEPVDGSGPGRTVQRFVEKPDASAAASYVISGYLWNAGIFLFRAQTFLNEFTAQQPAMARQTASAFVNATWQSQTASLDGVSWDTIEGTSIDYAVMEQTALGAVVSLDCGWSDVGSWNTLHELTPQDENGNVRIGEVSTTDVTGSYLRAATKPIVAIGVSDLIVVETPDAILVMKRDDAERVKDVAQALPDHLR